MNKRQIKKNCKKDELLRVGDFSFESYKELKKFYRRIDHIRNRRRYRHWRLAYLKKLKRAMSD